MPEVTKTAPPAPTICKNTCRTLILSDCPAVEDYFGSHDRIASALAEMIHDEKGGRSVALEGEWGSGKTTVINLLKFKLTATDKCSIPVFDAWAHEGDPLRRTFIETVARHLIEIKWIEQSNWTKRLDELAQKLEVKRTKTIPQITKWGKWVALSLFFIPIGLTLLAAALREDATLRIGAPHLKFWIEFVVGALLSLSPLLLILVALRSAGDGTGKSSEEKAAQLWSMFFNRTYTEESSETAKSANPTSIEFESTFVELMAEALGPESSRRLVLVLDNLDRIDPEGALSVWSTLQTFLRHAHFTPYTWSEQLWVLVPYDSRAVKLPWDWDEPNSGIRSALLEKSFQLRFFVPPPVLSRWHAFLTDRLKEAFPDHNEAEFHAVYQLLSLTTGLFPQPPTIRQLKLFVNQIGSFHRQWRDRFPLPYIAYYVLLTNVFHAEGKGNPATLITGHLNEVSSSILGVESDEDKGKLQDAFAALHFNTDVEIARQLLLEKPITDCLTASESINTVQLAELAATYPGFWEVLERILASNPFHDRGDLLGTAVARIAESRILDQPSTETIAVRQTLCGLASRTNIDWLRNLYGLPLVGLCHLFSWKSDRVFILRVLGQVSSRFLAFDGDVRSFNSVGWSTALKEIAKRLRMAGQQDLFAEAVINPFVKSLEAADAVNTPVLVAVFTSLSDMRKSEQLAEENLKELALKGHILYQLGSISFEQLMAAARAVRDARKSNKPLPPQSRENQITEAVAWCMYAHLQYCPHLIPPSQDPRKEEGFHHLQQILTQTEGFYDFASPFTRILLRYREVGFLNVLFDEEPATKPFVLECLGSMEEIDYKDLISPNLRAAWIDKQLVPEF